MIIDYAGRKRQTTSYPKSKIKVLLLENISQKAVVKFEKEGYPVEYFEKSLDEKNLQKKIKDTFILGIRSKTEITPHVLEKAPKLLTVGAFCIGTNQIDLITAAKRGVAVFNAPYSNTRSVVELVLGEIIMLARGVMEKNNKLHSGDWDKSAKGSVEVRGKTLGIIGYGNIGSQLSVLAENLGMKVYFYDIVEKLALGNAKKCLTLKELLKISDFVSVHVDGRPENKNLIGQREFQQMKNGVCFLNASRGSIVDIEALTAFLKNAKIKAAAIDVFPKEPKAKGEKFVSSLQKFPNVILTPHVAGSTIEAQNNIAEFVSDKIIEYINTGSSFLSVNLPNIQLPKSKKFNRLLHLHENVPGILAQINSVLARYKINIEGQYLKTNEYVGYVITDVNKKYDPKVLTELKKIRNTIRFRVLY